MSRTALEILTPIAETISYTYNRAIHGDNPESTIRLNLAVRKYLTNLTGAEDYEEVLAVTTFGLAQGLNSSALGLEEDKGQPFYAARLALFETFTRVLGSPDATTHTELWTGAEIAEYRGVVRQSVKNAESQGRLPAPAFRTRSGAALYDPRLAALWADTTPRRNRG